MKIAGLDSSGPNYMVIGVIIGEEASLRVLYDAVRGGRRKLHLRRMGRRDRERAARRFIVELKRLGGAVQALYIRTGVAEALAEARRRYPYIPSIRIRRACLTALASLLAATLASLEARRAYCDVEVAEPLRAIGLSPLVGGYPAELADVVAWLGHRVEAGRWHSPLSPVEALDYSDKLRALTLEKLER